MKNKLLVMSILLTVVTLNTILGAYGVEEISDVQTIKQQSLSMPNAQEMIARATGYETKNINIEPTVHRLTITVLDSTLNIGVYRDREYEATKMVITLSNLINEKKEFAQVVIIHVDYVQSSGNKKSIEAYEFYKSPAGVFVIHKS